MSDLNLPARTEFLLYQSDDGRVKLEVRLQDETIWLTQQMMADLFQSSKQNISHHIQSVFDEDELSPEATHKKFLSVRQEGSRKVQRGLDFYNLDMIISVGYRVKSRIATRFRIWATQRLKEYIIKGFVIDDFIKTSNIRWFPSSSLGTREWEALASPLYPESNHGESTRRFHSIVLARR
ncbi:MAG: RhuM family protein [Pseudomonadota bacterium]